MGLSELQANRLIELGMSERAKRIDLHQRYVDNSVYEGRDHFLDPASEQPLFKRKPHVIYPGVRNAIRALAAMCLGDGRFPEVSSASSEDDQAFDKRFGLNTTDSETLDTGIKKIVDQACLESGSRHILEQAMGSGSVAVLASVVRGRLRLFTMDPKCCEPEFAADDPDAVVKITESYRYKTMEFNIVSGKMEPHVYQYRRVIDQKFDTVYEPVEVLRDTDFPVPSTEKTKFQHGFGFCPVLWYGYSRSDSTTSDYDGTPVHAGLLGLIDAVNFGLSQRNRAALYCGDPQVVELGVEDEDIRVPVANVELTKDPSGWGQPAIMKRSGSMTARKKGAGAVWRYTSPDADCKILALPGDALKCLADDVDENKKTLREALGFVYVAPEDITGSGDISGKTLLVTRLPEIQTCNRIREEFWRRLLLPLFGMLLRIVIRVESGLYLAGAEKIRGIAKRFEQPVGKTLSAGDAGPDDDKAKEEQTSTMWFQPQLAPKWGDYFEPSDVDEQTRVQTAISAKKEGIILPKTAVEHVAQVFNIQNADEYAVALEEHKQEEQQQLHEAMAALNGGAPGDDNLNAKPRKPPAGPAAGGSAASARAKGKGGSASGRQPPAAAS